MFILSSAPGAVVFERLLRWSGNRGIVDRREGIHTRYFAQSTLDLMRLFGTHRQRNEVWASDLANSTQQLFRAMSQRKCSAGG